MMIKINFSKNSLKIFGKNCVLFWLKHQTAIFSILLLIAIGAGGYVWFQSMYRSSWSEGKKSEFLKEQDTGVKLREREMTRIIGEIEKRKESNLKQLDLTRDIFAK